MASFADNVFDVFSQLCENHCFVPAKAASGKDFASFVRKVSPECYVYVFVHDGRRGDGELAVSVWVAPPHAPDDGLDKLNVGYKVQIASAYDVGDDFFECCKERIVNLLPALGALSQVVQEEVSHQRFRSQRWAAYKSERQAFDSLKAMATDRADAACAMAVSCAREVAQDGNSFGSLEKACVAAAKSLLDHNALPAEATAFYDGDADFIASCVAGHLYVDALVGSL